MQSLLTSRSRRSRSGFTLIELMVVILIISILSGIVLTAMNSSDDSRALDAAVTRMESLFSLARSAAITRKQPTRVLISYDPSNLDDPEKIQPFLRYATIVYKDDDGAWKPYTQGEFLPDGIYFSPALSTKGGASPIQLERWDLTINFTTLEITQPPSDNTTSFGPFTLSGNTENISGAAANRWLSFEFNPNGTFAKPGARVVLLPGVLDGTGKLLISMEPGGSASDLARGFVIFRSGKTYFFQSGGQIEDGN